MKILLIDVPVHIPTVMPYSITMMHSVLSSCLDEDIDVLDLNSEYHYKQFNSFYKRIKSEDYFLVLEEFLNETRHVYPKISKNAVSGKKPLGFDFLIKQILSKKPDVVALSLTYNSQVFLTNGIIDELNKKGIKVIIGGPADCTKIKDKALYLDNYDQLIKHLIKLGAKEKKNMEKSFLDFSKYDKSKYFSKETVYPIRTTHSCPYKLCAFCTHHGNKKYETIRLDFIKDSIEKNNMKKVFFIDDGFSKKRLIEIIDLMNNYDIDFWMQLRPEKWIIDLLPRLYKAGLRSAAWGIESGSQRILDFMNKGTNAKQNSIVLKESSKLGIKNIVYTMFGFPTETEPEFMETITFLEESKDQIDLISPTVFGLQKGSRAYEHRDKFGIKNISKEKRTLLGEKIIFNPKAGLAKEQISKLKRKYNSQINQINKVPKVINACKEQSLNC